MNRAERRRQEREGKKQGKAIGVIFSSPSPAWLPIVHRFMEDHVGHYFQIEDDLRATLTLRCVDCEDGDENDKRETKIEFTGKKG
jgi:hypothetical protein